MDPTRRDEYKQRLYDLTPVDGKSVGNASLRERLAAAFPTDTFTREDYFDLRNSLRTEGKLETGRGKGGSVHRVTAAAQAPEGLTPTPVATEVTEAPEPP